MRSELVVENFCHQERTCRQAFSRVLPTVTIQELNQLESTLICGAKLLKLGLPFISGFSDFHLGAFPIIAGVVS
jgi:hypothetical protein